MIFKIGALEEFFFLASDSSNNLPLSYSKVFNQHVCFCDFIFHEEQKHVCKKVIFFCISFTSARVIAPFTASIKTYL